MEAFRVVNVNMTTGFPFAGHCFVLLSNDKSFVSKHMGQLHSAARGSLNELSSILLPHRKDVKQLQCEGENRCIVKDNPPTERLS